MRDSLLRLPGSVAVAWLVVVCSATVSSAQEVADPFTTGSDGLGGSAAPSPLPVPIAPPFAGAGSSQTPADPPPQSMVANPRLEAALHTIQIHGSLSEGGFISTANDYIGRSSRGSLEFYEAAVNVSAELTDKLHAGLQLFSQDEGTANDATPQLDWGYLDYHAASWFGFRAGRVRIPFGLYNEYIDIDAARLQVLLPQSVYPFSGRDILTAQNGFAVYGTLRSTWAGEVDYEVYGGVLTIPLPSGQDANSTRVYQYDSKYVMGAQLYWHLPVDGLRVGGSVLHASLDEYLNLAPAETAALIAGGAAPASFDGNIVLSIAPADFLIASAEYLHGDWGLAAEYSRWYLYSYTTPINLLPSAESKSDSERFYGLVTYRLAPRLDSGLYYSVINSDASDRSGSNKTLFAEPYYAWSRDATASLRYDVSDHWLWKVEAHFIDGAAEVDTSIDPMPKRYWGLFLIRTTVTF